jgi:hypothetical protein
MKANEESGHDKWSKAMDWLDDVFEPWFEKLSAKPHRDDEGWFYPLDPEVPEEAEIGNGLERMQRENRYMSYVLDILAQKSLRVDEDFVWRVYLV